MSTFLNRIIRALQLDAKVYLELTAERPLLQAMALGLGSSIASGVGGVGGYIEKAPFAALMAFVAWITWTVLIYILGARIFPEPGMKTDLVAVFCVTGFASIPGVFRFLAFLPAFSIIVAFGATLLMFGAMVVATQQVLHYRSMPRSILINFIGWIVYQWILLQA